MTRGSAERTTELRSKLEWAEDIQPDKGYAAFDQGQGKEDMEKKTAMEGLNILEPSTFQEYSTLEADVREEEGNDNAVKELLAAWRTAFD